MKDGFLQSVSNLDKNRDFKAVFLGNPIDPFDQLGIAAEPKDGGWDKHAEPTKTVTWPTKFYNGIALNLVGTDSPNFDYPADQPTRYPYLISREAMRNTEEFYGKDSLQYYSQCIGVMKTGIVGRRVISLEMCRQFQAFEEPIWGTEIQRTKVYAVDAAYGFIGGDRCVGGWIEFGKDKDGKIIVAMHPPIIIPVSIRLGIPEDQIAKFVMEDCERNNIPPHHVFFDATGRGSLGTSFARIWSPSVNPIEFGGAASPRPVSKDLYIYDPKTKSKRYKRCDEEYSKFVTELWFTVRHIVEGGQMRGMTMDVAREFALREWKLIKSGKIEIESKDETKKRMGRSPDLADCFLGDTLVLTTDGEIPIQDVKIGQRIITPFGSSPVLLIHEKQVNELTTVHFSNGSSLTGKGKHKVFTWENGWVRLDSLTLDIEVESSQNLPIWHMLNALFTRDRSIGFKQQVGTIKTETRLHRKDFYTGLSGLSAMDLFQKACASIIKTVIGLTTLQRTWNSWIFKNMPGCTLQNAGKIQRLASHSENLCEKQFSMLEHGTVLMPEENGTLKMRNIFGGISESLSHYHAERVENSLKHDVQDMHNIAHCDAGQKSITQNIKTLFAFVVCVVKNLLRTGTMQHHIAPITVRQSQLQESKWVYNLTLTSDNAYYANGILVDNCLVTAVEGARRLGFQINKLASQDLPDKQNDFLRTLQKKSFDLQRSKELKAA